LPLHPAMTPADVDHVADSLADGLRATCPAEVEQA